MTVPRNNTYLIPMIISICLLSVFLYRFILTEYYNEMELIVAEEREVAFANVLEEIALLSDRTVEEVDSTLLADDVFASKNVSVYSTNAKDQDVLMIIDSMESKLNSIKIIEQKSNSNEYIHPSRSKILLGILPQLIFSFLLLGSVLLTFYMIRRHILRERLHIDMRNNLMSNMSHELKTPVATIGVALEALQSFDAADDATKRKEYINISKNEVSRLGLLIDKTLNVSLFESGSFQLNTQVIDLHEEVEKIHRTMKLHIENHRAEVSIRTKGDNFSLEGDRTHLTNVVYNLLENALKYSSKSPKITIDLNDDGKKITMIIADNGIGIEPKYRKRVFDKLFRVPVGDTHDVKGHGLGLSYVKEVVHQHKGSIAAEESPLGGIAFRITLPKYHTA